MIDEKSQNRNGWEPTIKNIGVPINTVLNEGCMTTMAKMPDKCINMVMTSPPFWALRDYSGAEMIWGGDKDCEHEWLLHTKKPAGGRGSKCANVGANKNDIANLRDHDIITKFCNKCTAWKGQLGLEPKFDDYISHLCDIFDEVKRILRDDGTIWINIGDTYYTKSGSGFVNDNLNPKSKEEIEKTTGINIANELRGQGLLPSKSLTMIPFRFAIGMVERGWVLRNTIIWYKKNCMPSSVKDRFTVDFEYLFFFSKKRKYYFEQQFEPVKEVSIERAKYGLNQTDHKGKAVNVQNLDKMGERFVNSNGRNKRTVWTINPKPFSEAHFATFPLELVETPIKAGCPEFVCKKCGKPKKQVRTITKSKDAFNIRVRDVKEERIKHTDRVASKEEVDNYNEKQYNPTFDHVISEGCNCNAGFTAGIIYDPFFGAGTTGLVAHRLNRNFIGSEISSEYCKIAEKRLSSTKQIQFA